MSITVLTPEDWHMVQPREGRRHLSMIIHRESPFLRLLQAEPNSYTQPHSHSEPEVMIVLKGRLIFNGQWCEPGTVVYVPPNEDYWFSTGGERCLVALMRPKDEGINRHAVEAIAGERYGSAPLAIIAPEETLRALPAPSR